MGSTDTEINWTKEHQHQPTPSEQTLAQRREHPYICATWLPRLLTGENSCEWAVWFKAHHQDWTRGPLRVQPSGVDAEPALHCLNETEEPSGKHAVKTCTLRVRTASVCEGNQPRWPADPT